LGLGAFPHARDANAQAFCARRAKMSNNNVVLHTTLHIGRIAAKNHRSCVLLEKTEKLNAYKDFQAHFEVVDDNKNLTPR
jgi:hypothetical protein